METRNKRQRSKPKVTRRHRRTTRGGKYISKGSFGCGFASPALRCKGEAAPRPNTFSKLSLADEAAREYELAAIIRRLDPNNEFSIYPNQICDLSEDDIMASSTATNSENNLLDCPIVTGTADTPTDLLSRADLFKIQQMPAGGQSLHGYVPRPADAIPVFRSMLQVMKGLAKMHAAGYYHMDIKPQNMVIDAAHHIRLIDFGNATGVGEFTSGTGSPRLGDGNYAFWPFDVRFAEKRIFTAYEASLKKGSPSIQTAIDAFLRKSPPHLKYIIPTTIYYTPFGQPRLTMESLQALFRDIETTYGGYSEKVAADLLGKVDVYSVAIILCTLYTAIFSHYVGYNAQGQARLTYVPFKDKESYMDELLEDYSDAEISQIDYEIQTKVSMPFYVLIADMLSINPLERPTMVEAAVWFEKIFSLMQKTLGKYPISGRNTTPNTITIPAIKENVGSPALSVGDMLPNQEIKVAAAAVAAESPASDPASIAASVSSGTGSDPKSVATSSNNSSAERKLPHVPSLQTRKRPRGNNNGADSVTNATRKAKRPTIRNI
jgi:serine/threonine protein kinase